MTSSHITRPATASLTFWRSLTVAFFLASASDAEGARGARATTTPLHAAAAEEMWLAVAVNGQLTGTTALVRYDHKGNLWVGESELKQWRLPLPDEVDTSVPGTALYPLNAFDGLTFNVNESSQTLTVDVPAGLFERVQLESDKADFLATTGSAPGGFFNYDVVAQNSIDGVSASALFEVGGFGRLGTGTTRFLEHQEKEGLETVRLDTTWTFDHRESLASLRVGDSITGASRWWGGAVRFGGVQWASNFATQPGLITMPLPSIGGESALPSTLELYVNDALRMRREVPGGPFTLNDVPIVSGDGQIRLVVRDMLGREQVITENYYASPRLLRKGLHDYSFEAGAVRENFGTENNDYGRPLLVATERYGFTNHFTGEVHTELLEDQQTIGFAGAVLVPHVGSLSLGLAGSTSDRGTGQLATVGFERMAARFSFGVNAEVASETFMRLGIRNTTRVPRITGRLFSTVGFGRAGSLSLLATRREYQSGEITDLVSLRHSLDLRGVGYLSLSAIRIAGTERDTLFGLSFSRSLGNRLHANSAITSDSDGVAGYAQVQKGLPSDTGMGYRMRARAGVLQGVDGAVSYQGDYGTYSLEAEHFQSGTQARASMSGGLALMSAGLFPSRRIDGSFAVARVGEEADVRVYRDNQLVGRTNEEGYILLPGLRAYEGNQISIEQADLPLDISVQALQVKAVPAYRSGVVLAFPVERSRGALLSVMLENGEPLPAGALVTVMGQPETYPVGVRGEVYIGRLADQNQLRATWHDGSCELDVAYTPSEDPLPHLGSFECRATP